MPDNKGSNNPMHGYHYWNNPAAKDPHCQEAYSLMPEMFEFYMARKHKKRGWGYKAFADHIGWSHCVRSLETPMKWVRENGDPRNNEEWLAFYFDYLSEVSSGEEE